jgi:hypothetical protein
VKQLGAAPAVGLAFEDVTPGVPLSYDKPDEMDVLL